MRKGGERCVAPPLQPPVLFIQTAMRSRRLINNFPEGRGPPSLYPPLPYFATWKFKSPGHQESANLVSSPVAPTFISLYSEGEGVRLSTCIVAKVFRPDISFIELGPPCTCTQRSKGFSYCCLPSRFEFK